MLGRIADVRSTVPQGLEAAGSANSTAQVLLPLLTNAQRHAPGSAVEVRAAKTLEGVALYVDVIDGAKALASAVIAVFDQPAIQRCQLHRIRNVEQKLPDALASTVATKLRAAYQDPNPLSAEATLEAPARQLDKAHLGRRPACAKASPRP